MWRNCITQTSRTIGQTPRCPAFLHTSALRAAQTKSQSPNSKKYNIAKQAELRKQAITNRPSVVLGTRPSEEAQKWPNSYLARVLVDTEELTSNTGLKEMHQPVGSINVPKQMGFGVGEAETKMLFRYLPKLSAQAAVLQNKTLDSNLIETTLKTAESIELKKANNFAKVLDLRNANAGGISFENRRQIIMAFSDTENPYDTGRAEVQAALLTYKIRNLWSHLTKYKRDVGNRLGLRKLVHRRARILKYLKSVDEDRYEAVLEKLALEPEGVEGELIV